MKVTIINPEDFDCRAWAQIIAPRILRAILEQQDEEVHTDEEKQP